MSAWEDAREAALRYDFDEVERLTAELGMAITAYHARRARHDRDSAGAVWFALKLSKPEAPDPFREAARG